MAAGPPAAVSDTASANGPGGVDLETLRGAWTEILEGVRESGGELLWHALSVARPVSVDVEAKRFEVGFPPDAAFNKRRAESEAAREQLIESVGSVLGTSLRPSYALVEEIEIEAPAATVLSADELVARIKAEFDAEELYHDDTEAERQGDDEKAPEARRKA
ncbi:MAG: hypothetical protein H0W09_02755 [Solirubrobacterales bacterium]|nr:hypothetical protein [Solirubrobacterales bacterium]